MVAQIDPKDLYGQWLHAHEEDVEGMAVFRPANAAFPPSRGRAGMAFDASGALAVIGPGADDRNLKSDSKWRIKRTGQLELGTSLSGIDGTSFTVVRDGERLILKPFVKT